MATYPQGFKTWMGPVLPIITLCHPDIIRSVLSASGTQGTLVVVWLWEAEGFKSPCSCICVTSEVAQSFFLLTFSTFC